MKVRDISGIVFSVRAGEQDEDEEDSMDFLVMMMEWIMEKFARVTSTIGRKVKKKLKRAMRTT